jgi:hypothetical protein
VEVDALAFQPGAQEGHRLRLLLAQQPVRAVDEVDLAAEAAEGLTQFAADRAGADDNQPARQVGQAEHGLVGQRADLGQPGQGQRGGAGAGGDHRSGKPERLAVDGDGIGAREPGLPQEDIDAQLTETLGGVVMADAGPQPAHALHDGGEIDLDGPGHAHPELARTADLGNGPGAAEQGLGRHAAVVEAVAAHQVFLDQGHLRAQAGRPGGADQPGRPRPDHHEVVAAGRSRVDPVRRVDVGHQLPVVTVGGHHLGDLAAPRLRQRGLGHRALSLSLSDQSSSGL